jgi:uncharacterized membrane protein
MLVVVVVVVVVIILFQFSSVLIHLRDNSQKANRKVNTNKENQEKQTQTI